MVVLRTYRVRVDPRKAADYERWERLKGVPMVARQDGCLGCGFGRLREAGEPTYLFYSMWETQAALDSARASDAWRKVASQLESKGFSLGGDAAEHLDVLAHFMFQASPAPSKPSNEPTSPRR